MDNYNGQYGNGYQGDPYGGQYNNGYQQGGYSGGPTNQNHPSFTKYMVLSILMLLCCNQICGVIALIMAVIGNGNYKKGMPYEGNFKAAKILLIVGLVLGIVLSIVALLMGVAGSLPLIQELMD